jgi:hypothetical protein
LKIDENFQKLSFGLTFAIFLQLFLSQDMTTLYSICFKIINFQITNYSKIHLNEIQNWGVCVQYDRWLDNERSTVPLLPLYGLALIFL